MTQETCGYTECTRPAVGGGGMDGEPWCDLHRPCACGALMLDHADTASGGSHGVTLGEAATAVERACAGLLDLPEGMAMAIADAVLALVEDCDEGGAS